VSALVRNMALPGSLRLALREMRDGLKGFRIFLACLILGVTAIAAVGSLTAALTAGMAEEGRKLLAADAELRLSGAELTAEQREWLLERGDISPSLRLRTNVFAPGSDERTLAELRAVEPVYPYYGTLEVVPPAPREGLLAERDGRWGVLLDETLEQRLQVEIGDPVKLGSMTFDLRGFIANEPDRANYGFQLGPTAMIHWDIAPETGLLERGSRTNYYYKIRLPAGSDVTAWREALEASFPDAQWRIRTHKNSAQGIRRFIERMGTFLTLVGLTALVVGGVGVGNAVRAYLDRKTDTIATLKILGAEGGTVFRIYLTQILMLTAVAVAGGLVLGAALPLAVGGLLTGALPVPPRAGLYAGPLVLAGLYGTLITVAFTVWPLGRARDIPAARLFRNIVSPEHARPRRIYQAIMLGAAGLVAALAIVLAEQRELAAGFAASALLALGILRGGGWAIQRLAARLPRVRIPQLRLAIANLHRPGAATGPVVVSLGLGLTLFAALALVEGNLRGEVDRQIPERAPAFFFVDIQPWQHDDFVATAQSLEGVSNLESVPYMRGTITHVDGVPAAEVDAAPGSGWVLRGDRGVSYTETLPEGNDLVSGEWWPADYSGPPLVSLAAEEGRGLGLDLGDTITVSVLGREITAEVASFRRVEWGTININFVVLLDPHTLARAPHTYMATLEADGAAEANAYRVLTDRFPNVTAVRIKEILASLNSLLGQIGTAVRATAIITIFAGVLVLAGAMAAGHRHRVYDSVILKVLGAVRSDVLGAYLIEYALLGVLTGLVALVLGGLGGWYVVEELMGIDFRLMPVAMVATVAASIAVTLLFGLASTWRALGVRTASVLRES